MSKQSEVKKEQGYDPKPINPVCMNCKHYTSKFVDEGNHWSLQRETKIRCGIGGFAVKKIATCKLYERKD